MNVCKSTKYVLQGVQHYLCIEVSLWNRIVSIYAKKISMKDAQWSVSKIKQKFLFYIVDTEYLFRWECKIYVRGILF